MATAVKTLKDIPQLGVASTDAMCERLLSFLAAYREQNAGATPTWAVIANQLGIIEEGVRPLVAKLESQGRLFIVSRNPLSLMLTQPGQPNPAEPGAADLAAAKPGAYGRFLDAEAERMRLARFVGQVERDKGRGPSLREMIDFVGWAEPARVQRMAEMLASKGVLQFGRGVPTKLTAQGRQVLGFGQQKMEQPKMEQETKKRTLVVVQTGRIPAKKRVKELCEALAARVRAHGDDGYYTRHTELAVDLGFSAASGAAISRIAAEAVRLGYLLPKRPKTHGLFFTEKGRAKFMPETVTGGDANALECEEPIVSQVARAVGSSDRSAFSPAGIMAAARVASQTNPLDFNLTGDGLNVRGQTNSRAELAAFIGKLGALMPFLGE